MDWMVAEFRPLGMPGANPPRFPDVGSNDPV